MARQAVELAGNDGLILVEDGMAAPAIRYVAWRTPPDERIIARSAEPGMFERALSESRSVVLVPLNVDEPGVEPPVGSWKRNGDLYVLAASD